MNKKQREKTVKPVKNKNCKTAKNYVLEEIVGIVRGPS